MIDPTGKAAAAVVLILAVFSYMGDIVPKEYRLYTLFIGFAVVVILLLRPTINITLAAIMPRLMDKYCRNYSNEKYFRFLSINKVVTVYPDGKGLIYTKYDALNEGEDHIHRFPHKFHTGTATIKDSLETLQAQNNFEVRSLDAHILKWEPVKNNEKNKSICVIHNDNINPGEQRKYSIRYQIDGLYKVRRTDLPDGGREGSGFKPLHICNKFALKLKFLPNYKYSNLRYCVLSPSKEEVHDKCKDITAIHDTETGGTFVEIEEINPWRNFEYRVEWIPEN